jgi:hypothetical protein
MTVRTTRLHVDNLQKHWETLDGLLRQSLDDVRSLLPAQDARSVEEFIEHNEFGLAYEWLMDTLDECSISIDEATSSRLREAAQLMEL